MDRNGYRDLRAIRPHRIFSTEIGPESHAEWLKAIPARATLSSHSVLSVDAGIAVATLRSFAAMSRSRCDFGVDLGQICMRCRSTSEKILKAFAPVE
jgi:hypothetical protein